MSSSTEQGFFARLAASRRAASRRAAWDNLRLHDGGRPALLTSQAAVDFPERQTTAPNPQEAADSQLTAGPRRAVWLWPLLGAAGITAGLVGGAPWISGAWNWYWVAGGAATAALAAAQTLRAWARGLTRQVGAGLAVAGVLVAACLVGLSTQVVIGGQVQLTTSDTAEAVRLTEEALTALDVLRGNQLLLNLPAEQAAALLGTYDAAIEQNRRLAERWNPATAGELPGEGFVSVFAELNRASVRQAEALAGFSMNINNPADSIAAEVAVLRAALEAQLTPGSGIEALISDAYRRSTRHAARADTSPSSSEEG